MTARDHDDYLWNPEAPPDPDIERLEAALSPLRHDEPLRAPPKMPVRTTVWAVRVSIPLAAAASIALLVGASILGGTAEPDPVATCEAAGAETAWAVTPDRGAPSCGDAPLDSAARLVEGRAIRTDADASATIRVADIGTVVVQPNSSVRLVSTREDEHRLKLEHGEIHAQIDAPPRLFVVETASSTAYDLGCEYTLTVDERGNGLLHVSFGYVSLEHDGRTSWVPEGAMCQTREGLGPGTPYHEGASEQLVAALAEFDFGADKSAVDRVVALARANDAITLWHLLRRVDADQRGRVYRRLAELSPPPDEVRENDVMRADDQALEAWRADIEVVGFNPEDGEGGD